MTQVEELLARMRALGSPENVAGMARFGIRSAVAYGVGSGPLRELAKPLRRNQSLSSALWDTGVLEARILAALVGDAAQITEAEMDRWAHEFDNWAVCDGCCLHLFRKSPWAWKKAVEWCGNQEEFVRRAGFAMIATLAVHDKQAPDAQFVKMLKLIERAAGDDRNFVKKAVNWALRQIGKRNHALRGQAIECALRIQAKGTRSGRWIAADALRELR